MPRKTRVNQKDYRRLLEFRSGLRQFLHWSQAQAATVGLSPGQHQLLLSIMGHDDKRGPTIGDVAAYLMLKHHSAVELIDRAEAAGLVERYRDPDDRRVVRLKCTAGGRDKLESLTLATLEELARLAPELSQIWDGLQE